MSWTAPMTWVTGTVVTAANLNANVRDNSLFLEDPPAVIATRTADLNVANATLTVVPWTAGDVIDTASMHDTITNNTRLTFPRAGEFRVSYAVSWAAGATGSRKAIVYKNTNGIPTGTAQVIGADSKPADGTGNTSHAGSCSLQAAANDYVELFVFQASGGALHLFGTGTALNVNDGGGLAPCFFAAEWLGAGV